MRILYTVHGEGNGHAFRSSIIIDHLLENGHKVHILASNKAYAYLSKRYPSVKEVMGLILEYENNEVKKGKTLLENFPKVKEIPENLKIIKKELKTFDPDVIITDFEPSGAIAAALSKKPLISIDNMHVFTEAKVQVNPKDYPSYLIAKAITEAMVPSRDYTFITTFFYPKLKKSSKNTWLFPPLVREEILKAKPKEGKHILVYQTSDSKNDLMGILKNINEKFVIYNGNRDITGQNLIFRDFSPTQIIDDMAEAKGVILNGGFTIISECLHLKKPMLSIPIKGQYEQILNARMIEKLRIGKMTTSITKEVLADWLRNLPLYEKNISKVKIDNNLLLRKLDQILLEVKEGQTISV